MKFQRLALAASLFILGACSAPMVGPVRDVDPGTALAIAAQADTLVMDVRTAQEYAAEHIKGAVLVPITDIEKDVARLPIDRDKRLLVYCGSGKRSSRASAFLARLGYTHINNLLGGIAAWKNAGQPVIK